MDEKILQSMRLMAWERAKGELKSMMQTHYGATEKAGILDKTISDFIEDIEDNGKHE